MLNSISTPSMIALSIIKIIFKIRLAVPKIIAIKQTNMTLFRFVILIKIDANGVTIYLL